MRLVPYMQILCRSLSELEHKKYLNATTGIKTAHHF